MDWEGPETCVEGDVSEPMAIKHHRECGSVHLLADLTNSMPMLSLTLSTLALIVEKPKKQKQSSDPWGPVFTRFAWNRSNTREMKEGGFERSKLYHVCIVHRCNWFILAAGRGASDKARKHVMDTHFGQTDEIDAGIERLMDYWKTNRMYLRPGQKEVDSEKSLE
jgi:hypothetical protein